MKDLPESHTADTHTLDVPEPRRPESEGVSPPVGRTIGGWRPLLLRLHFYAGVLVAPFLAIAALTGLAYTLTPQLDRLVYADELYVEEVGTTPRPLAEQISAALAAHPEGTFGSVLTGDAPDRTTRVVLSVPGLGDRQRTVYVDPYTGRVQGALTTWWGSTPLTTWLDDLHRNLHLGAFGRHYSETAASWLWIVALGGLVLWLARRRQALGASQASQASETSQARRARRMRAVLLPDLTARGRRRTLGWHGSLGVWLLVGLLFLSATGLTWSRYAGEHFSRVLDAADSHMPSLDTTLPQAASTTTTGGGGGAHQGHAVDGPGTTDAGTTDAGTTDAGTTDAGTTDAGATDAGAVASSVAEPVDRVVSAARAAGLDGPIEVTPATDTATAWSAAQTDGRWPVRFDQVAVNPVDGRVVNEVRWEDWPLLAQLTKLGVRAHMGELFGVANQILLAGLALGLLCMIVWGYRMWWQRRPSRGDRAGIVGPPPARGAWRRLPKPALAALILITAAVGWAPVLGVTLLVFLLLDLTAGLLARRRRKPARGASA
ncbi:MULTISPECIES: PepSY-associated TM helix domain-containing protein [Parafrankia]|nr:PepSY domain-containing protein [Parafrankia sp. CH37]